MEDCSADAEFKGSDADLASFENKVEDVEPSCDSTQSENHPSEANDSSALNEFVAENAENQTDNGANLASVLEFDADADGDENEGDDDIVNVIIKPSSKGGIYKTGAAYQARSVAHTVQHAKPSRQGIELDDPGDIHGVPTIEFNLSSLGEEDKPWKRPGADITDYFNYGFTEETWILYCEKQKILRQEYANATIKPVLTTGGTGLLQRIRTGTANTGIRSYDAFKQANINVINLSNNSSAARNLAVGIVNQKTASDTAALLLNGVANNSANILATFTQPPPGYASGTSQADNSGTFGVPPPGFAALGAGGASQLLTNTGATAAAGLFPNVALPPPMLNALSNWSGSVGVHNLLAAGDAVIDPTTGQISTLLEHSGRSPESVYSSEEPSSRRKSRHYHGDESGYFERDSYRPRRRSRSSSRERHHSRHRRHHDSGRSERDYDRRSTRRSQRSRERSSRDERGQIDDLLEAEGFCPPTSAVLRSDRRDRVRSSRDHSRSDRGDGSEKGSHRSHRHGHERSSRSSRSSKRRSRSRSSHRRETVSPAKASAQSSEPPVSSHASDTSKPTDPLMAAAAAAANIALALGASAKSSP